MHRQWYGSVTTKNDALPDEYYICHHNKHTLLHISICDWQTYKKTEWSTADTILGNSLSIKEKITLLESETTQPMHRQWYGSTFVTMPDFLSTFVYMHVTSRNAIEHCSKLPWRWWHLNRYEIALETSYTNRKQNITEPYMLFAHGIGN